MITQIIGVSTFRKRILTGEFDLSTTLLERPSALSNVRVQKK
ncbi:16538_t:CDS:2 [Acaulospora colombiana]|uniref:16538_t:CDS:1 n=1 Tax=Acaulospora colombiana TaxID=27376 RepID=A0ACA9L1C7_9GLOM|nr:16538_t:CDS:2 [Acaulospora colombiana]